MKIIRKLKESKIYERIKAIGLIIFGVLVLWANMIPNMNTRAFIQLVLIPFVIFFIVRNNVTSMNKIKKTSLTEIDVHQLANNLELKMLGMAGGGTWLLKKILVTDIQNSKEIVVYILIFYILEIFDLIITIDISNIKRIVNHLEIDTIDIDKLKIYKGILYIFLGIVFLILYYLILKNNELIKQVSK